MGVTQAYAASVLRNAAGHVHFLIGRETDPENSEVRQRRKASASAVVAPAVDAAMYLVLLLIVSFEWHTRTIFTVSGVRCMNLRLVCMS